VPLTTPTVVGSLINSGQVYTNLFPARHTWYLLGTIFILNGIDWVAFEVLSIGNPTVEDLGSYRVLDGLFQAFGKISIAGFGLHSMPLLTNDIVR
jgi:hypothetical protein